MGKVIKSGYSELHRPYNDPEFVKYITIPDDLVHAWPEEMIDRIAVPPGVYELWSREDGNSFGGLVGDEYYWDNGAETKEGIFEEDQFAACLYHHFSYTGSTENFKYNFVFVSTFLEDGTIKTAEEIIYDLNPAEYGYGLVDDISVSSFKVFNLQGKPVYVFGYFRYYYTLGYDFIAYARYGLSYQGEVHLTDLFSIGDPKLGNNTQNIFNSTEGIEYFEGMALVGYGDVAAIGIETDYSEE
jgi:hypothetical protein